MAGGTPRPSEGEAAKAKGDEGSPPGSLPRTSSHTPPPPAKCCRRPPAPTAGSHPPTPPQGTAVAAFRPHTASAAAAGR